jgi:hypothetical protein
VSGKALLIISMGELPYKANIPLPPLFDIALQIAFEKVKI